MFKAILYKYLFKAILVILICLAAYGMCSTMGLAIVLVLFVCLRLIGLVTEARREPIPADHWDKMLVQLTVKFSRFSPADLMVRAKALKLDPRFSARDMARELVDKAMRDYEPPRPKLELGAEFLGALTFVLLIPLAGALSSTDIFSLRGGQAWAAALLAAFCAGLYAWPKHWLKSPDWSVTRILWWTLPFFMTAPLLLHLVVTRHPYLNPFEPDRHRLAAERVLSLKNNVVAGRYADWVLRYARELDERGETQKAIGYYREGLRLDASDQAAYTRLAILEALTPGNKTDVFPLVPATGPYWTEVHPVTPSPRGEIDSQLESVPCCTIVIVPVGKVPDELLDDIGFVIQQELRLPVCISTNVVAVPPYSRKQGFAVGPQWDQAALVAAFTNATRVFPRAPIRYLLVTAVDIYRTDANYIVSASYAWGALLSYARYGDPGGDVRVRTAKQSLCAVIKCFGVPASPDRNDVTSYVQDSAEFDAKGSRPNAETLNLFRRAVGDINRNWQMHRAME